ncbi:MAG: SH3 domain-containing protein, partial [Candidatus Omnitrophota bacterium]
MKALALLTIIILLTPLPLLCSLQQYEVTKDGINVRTDSTVQASSLGYLKRGERIDVVGEKFDWLRIILPKRFNCYVSADYVEEIDKRRGKVSASLLNLRTNPSRDAPVLGHIEEGKPLSIIRKQEGWYKVRAYPHARGWVHKKFLRKIESTELEKKIEIVEEKTEAVEEKAEVIVEAKKDAPAQEPSSRAPTLKEIILKLSQPHMRKKENLHQQLISMGVKIIPYLEAEMLNVDKNTAYSFIYVMSEIGKKNPSLVSNFL